MQENYADTLMRLQDIFYLYKNESLDELTDDERTIILKGCLINYYRDSSEE